MVVDRDTKDSSLEAPSGYERYKIPSLGRLTKKRDNFKKDVTGTVAIFG